LLYYDALFCAKLFYRKIRQLRTRIYKFPAQVKQPKMSDSQKPHFPAEGIDLPKIPATPKPPQDLEVDGRIKTTRYRTLTLIKSEGPTQGIIRKRVPFPEVVPIRGRKKPNVCLVGPSVKKAINHIAPRDPLKKSPGKDYSTGPDTSITSIARGRITHENPAALHDHELEAEAHKRKRLYQVYSRHAASTPGFHPMCTCEEAAKRLLRLKHQHPSLEEDKVEIFRSVAIIVLSALGHLYATRLNDERILSVARKIFDSNATYQGILSYLENTCTKEPLPPAGRHI
jgi:hypothetical protein